MDVHIIRVDGSEDRVQAPRTQIAELIGADTLDGFSLRDGRYVYVDDEGHFKDLPSNAKATELYWSICRPGTTHVICGDVAIVREHDL
jgi:hypothetical protein